MTVQADMSQRPARSRADSETSEPREPVATPMAGGGNGLAPLVAVCGVCGGIGTSTLSYLVARFALGRSGESVLVCDTGGPTGGLATCCGVESSRSLTELADDLGRGLSMAGGIYAVDDAASTPDRELRVIAAGPREVGVGEPRALEPLLEMARSDGAHSLTVVDCGTLQRRPELLALGAASHVVWVLPATRRGVRRAERVLAVRRSSRAARELVVARRDKREPAATLRALTALAERRHAPLVLMPQIADLLEQPQSALADAEITLQAILGVIQR